MSALIKPPCCNGLQDEKKQVYNGDSHVTETLTEDWETMYYDYNSNTITNKDRFFISHGLKLSNQGYAYEYSHFETIIKRDFEPNATPERIYEIATSVARFVVENPNYNGTITALLNNVINNRKE